MNRLKLLRCQLSATECGNNDNKDKNYKNNKIQDNAIDYFSYYDILTKEEKEYVLKFKNYLEVNVTPFLLPYLEKAEPPFELVKGIIKNFPKLISFANKGYGCAGFSQELVTALIYEICRCDASLVTFIYVHGELAMQSISILGSEEQKQYFLPKMADGELIGCFCLTEPEYGSDATSLITTAEEDEHGDFIINGKKKWIGNATHAGVFIIWARNTKTNKIEGFIGEAGNPGIRTEKIEGKLALRITQNAYVYFDNCKIRKNRKLPKANDFFSGTNKVLLTSRLGVAKSAVGLMIGAYDRVIKYCNERKQFGKPLVSFQITQVKLAKILGNITASIFMCERATELYKQGKLTIGMVGLCKAWCSLRMRETLRLARELMGGNGILMDNWVMKALIDGEAIFTYEGTYDINMLAAGKEITGLYAFK